ncbi:MAG TPA: hypothetical protein VF546_02950 [Pyrinomonadaceae bacterium]
MLAAAFVRRAHAATLACRTLVATFARRALAVALAVWFLVSAMPVRAQSKPKARAAKSAQAKQMKQPAQANEAAPQDELARLRAEFVAQTKKYKQSLEQLLALQEKEVARLADRLKQMRALQAEGLLAQRDLETHEQALKAAEAKTAATRQQMTQADTQVAESLVEAEAEELAARAPKTPAPGPAPAGRVTRVGSYVRYTGAGLWSLANAWKVQAFFQQQFGRPLPVSAFGQTAVHNQLGFDHRNSMDVPVQPNSAEGQALMAFLRANGIPFTAFTAAIPGAATGPHIHVGAPSHRLAAPR